MRSGQVDADSFSIFSDAGDMIGGAMVFDRKQVEVNVVTAYRDLDPLPGLPTPEMLAFEGRSPTAEYARRMTPSPELTILRWLAGRTYASAAEVAAAMALPPAQARTFLVVLETVRLVSGRQDPDSRASRRVFHVTVEGRRKAGMGDARQIGMP